MYGRSTPGVLRMPLHWQYIYLALQALQSALEHAMSVVVLISHTGSDYIVTAFP